MLVPLRAAQVPIMRASAALLLVLAPGRCAAQGAFCGFKKPGVTYDLSVLQLRPGDLTITAAVDGGQSTFYVHVCSPPQQQCTASKQDKTTIAGVQQWSSGGVDCASIGSLTTATWSLQDESNVLGGAQVSYTGGDGGRSFVIKFACDQTQLEPELRKPVTENPKDHYELTLASAAACPQTVPIPKTCGSMACGSIALILFFVFIVLYLVAGICYNQKHDAEGLEAIPQWRCAPGPLRSLPPVPRPSSTDLAPPHPPPTLAPRRYWQQLPGLVKDGCVLTYDQLAFCYRCSNQKLQEIRDGRGTREMRENLAPNGPEGGDE